MEVVIVILIIAALVGAVVWNHSNGSAATEGVEFGAPAEASAVVAAISSAYCGGAKAAVKRVFSGVRVRPDGSNRFIFETKIGDTGTIDVHPNNKSSSIVRAQATELYVGLPPKMHASRGIWGLSTKISHGLYQVLGVMPNAAKMKRLVRGLESRIGKQLDRSSAK